MEKERMREKEEERRTKDFNPARKILLRPCPNFAKIEATGFDLGNCHYILGMYDKVITAIAHQRASLGFCRLTDIYLN